MTTTMTTIAPQVAVVDFHHARGPEVEFWVDPAGAELAQRNDWSLLPFMALSDGAHAMVEEFSYFTLLDVDGDSEDHSTSTSNSKKTTLFGIACTRQIRAEKLKRRSTDVTRSTVQKAVVVIVPTARGMGELRERLGAVTAAWFAQEYNDPKGRFKFPVNEFQESLARSPAVHEEGKDHYFGLSLRELIHEFRHHTLSLVKCLLLQRKMLFYGSKCERLCMMQFALISLIPGLVRNLQDAADPSLDSYAQTVTRASALKTILAYMGLPLQIFGRGSFFGPYTPLQQLDILADYDTKSYVVGSTNSLLLQHKERYSDILVNLDESNSITISSPSLRSALALTAADRRWIDHLTQTVLDTWDPENPSQPKNLGYAGSEDAIRLQFEEYILSLLSSAAYQVWHEEATGTSNTGGTRGTGTGTGTVTGGTVATANAAAEQDIYNDITADFNPDFLAAWRTTHNFALFDRLTRNNRIFDIVEPRHPTAGGLSVEDVQRRLQQTITELHLDERVREGREQLGKTLAVGRERVGAGVARFWAEVERQRQNRTDRSSRSGSRGKTTQSQGDGGASPRSSLHQGRESSERKDSSGEGEGTGPTSPTFSTASGGVGASGGPGGWASSLRDRAARTTSQWQMQWQKEREEKQRQRPSSEGPGDPSTAPAAAGSPAATLTASQIQAAARENAAKAGAWMSSWGSWAKERVAVAQQQQQQQQRKSGGGAVSGAAAAEGGAIPKGAAPTVGADAAAPAAADDDGTTTGKNTR
ncbi:Late secretory pathway protein AVL9 [Exophiala dermatitidis]